MPEKLLFRVSAKNILVRIFGRVKRDLNGSEIVGIHTLANFGVQPSEAKVILSSFIPVILSVSLASNAVHILKTNSS